MLKFANKIILLAFLFSLLLVPVAGAQDYRAAVAAFKKGDYSAAFKTWQTLAMKGDANSQFNLGLMYETGLGVSQDYARALGWYRLAANRGQADAQNNLGFMYTSGLGVPQDEAKALIWYRKAAKQGHVLARNNLRMADTNKNSDTIASASPGSNKAEFQVQFGSFKSKYRAEREAARIAQAYKSVLGKLEVMTVPANLGERGVFYRVRANPLHDRASAMSLCHKFASRDQGCLVIEL